MTEPRSPTGPESITVDLEHARMLEKAGWPQEDALFYQIKHASSSAPFVVERSNMKQRDQDTLEICLAAPCAEEILRRLPRHPKNMYNIRIGRLVNGEWHIGYVDSQGYYMGGVLRISLSVANAAAALWCYLKSHNLLPLTTSPEPHA